jgi:site-specific recombinase XerD
MAMPAPQLVHSDSWLENVSGSFERALLREEMSPKTVRSYGIGIKNFFAFLRENGVDDFANINRDLLERWQDAMRERSDPPLRAGSRSLYGTAVRRLIGWAADRDIVDWKLERAIKGVKTRRRGSDHVRQPIPPEDLAILKAHFGPRRARMTVIDLRDRAIFWVLYATGVRVGELLQMPRENFQHSRVRQKGGTYINIEIPATVAGYVGEYLYTRHDDLPWLWLALGNNTNSIRQLADSGVREIWRRTCRQLGIEYFTTHQLRHTCATELRAAGVSEQGQADWLHHADTRTIHRYAADRGGEMRQNTLEVMEQLVRRGGPGIAPEMLSRRSTPGGRPRYGLR